MPRYLITCSSSKIEPNGHPNSQPSSIENLSFNCELGNIRNALINKILVKSNNPPINWNYTLPAWQLYSGPYSTIFSRVGQNLWEDPNTDVLIFSTVFGWVKHTDRLPIYSIEITDQCMLDDTCPIRRIYEFWRIPKIQTKLRSIIDCQNDIDLLYKKYRSKIFNPNNFIAQSPGINFPGRGHAIGNYLSNQLGG